MTTDGMMRKKRARGEHTLEQILDSAAEIIRMDGIKACTHRAVAQYLGISTGTITWHVGSLDNLHKSVLERAVLSFRNQTIEWFASAEKSQPAKLLTQFLFWTISENERLVREYELFIASVSRPLLRKTSATWLEVHSQILQDTLLLTKNQSDACVAYTDAWLLRSIIYDGAETLDPMLIEDAFNYILNSRGVHII
ncbi:TetR family transcriptional regulator [Klebsiella pneumoniae subsp. pneumoniae]|uniref:TetR/AcrR family transcriptional regulator n=1 Tax=Klebsiella pneumoniae TaxID=573 RepID=UPI0021B34240|nr:TetR family transcriptional regulator [Klebsiella pneumoniae]MCT6793364.1 TetR family transcriptional regulator [Klebsiella pneumoniae subsp. pneumoniae]